MIQARGGISSLQQNWRLGLVLQLYVIECFDAGRKRLTPAFAEFHSCPNHLGSIRRIISERFLTLLHTCPGMLYLVPAWICDGFDLCG